MTHRKRSTPPPPATEQRLPAEPRDLKPKRSDLPVEPEEILDPARPGVPTGGGPD